MANTFIYKDKEAELVIDADGRVYLRLLREGNYRGLGSISLWEGELTYFKSEKEKNTFRKLNAWGINDNIVKYLPRINSMVVIKTELGTYAIRKGTIQQQGKFMHFAQQGYERQIFVPKEAFTFTPIGVMERRVG